MKTVWSVPLAVSLLVIATLVTGCDPQEMQQAGVAEPPPPPPPPPKPLVEVNRSESSTGVSITVKYLHHDWDSTDRGFYATIDTMEKLQHYRKQAEFLIDQLDDAESRMNVHEQSEPKPVE